MKQWARRAAALYGELAELAELGDARWWLVAGGAALRWPARAGYVASDAEPSADTFLGHATPPPGDAVADAIARAYAARRAIRALDGSLPDQPLAVTVRRTPLGAIAEPSALDAAAFAIGDRTWVARLPDTAAGDAALAAELESAIAGGTPRTLAPPGAGLVPFVTVTLGEEPLETARHGHRRGWTTGAMPRGPWLGLSRAGGLATVSTCHLIVDGYGHAALTARLAAEAATRVPSAARRALPPPAPVADAIPLAIAWRDLAGPGPRALPLAYALGIVLHRAAGSRDARFSPTFQIPVAPGTPDDPIRLARRVVPAIASVRFDGGAPEPFEVFAARTRETLAREASGAGLSARLLAAAQGAPAPLAWKRRAVGAGRPRWLESVAELIGGRGCVSRIKTAAPLPPTCAVSSPARLASAGDPLGSCVVTVVDDGRRAALTLCGDGELARSALLDELLDRLAVSHT